MLGFLPKSWAELLTRERWIEIGRITLCGLLIFVYSRGLVPIYVLWVTIAIGLYPLVKTGIRDLFQERKIGTEIFVTIATLVAVFGGEAIAGAVLMVIILIAEFIAEFNTDRARASIRGLIGTVPQTATKREGDKEQTVQISSLMVGDVILVRAGERVSVDGSVLAGSGAVNEAPITGESTPAEKAVGALVFAGTVLESGALDIRADKIGADTTFARIIKLVEHAEESQAPVQKLADRVATILIPAVFIFLALVFYFTRDIRLIVTLLIFTSPAELGLATPMVMIAAIARAARSGILVKGGIFLETLAKADVIVFDKTGTLTVGKPAVESIKVLSPAFSEREILGLAAAADRRSGHPLASAVVAYAQAQGIEVSEPTDFAILQGRGVRAIVEGKVVLIGNRAHMSEQSVVAPPSESNHGRTELFVAVDGEIAAVLLVADQVRLGAKDAISRLKTTGIKRVIMLTGDNAATANVIAGETGITEIFADLLPEAKLTAIRDLQSQGHKVVMVGDGVNDAPALAQADVGIAMGAEGTQAAMEAADIALMTSDLSKIVMARAIAKTAYRTIQQNLFIGVGVVHVIGIAAALMRLIGPIQAAIIHLGPDILVFVNSVKLLRVRISEKC